MEQYPITDREEFDKKYSTVEGEDHRMLNKLLQMARYILDNKVWIKAVPYTEKVRDRKFPWTKREYTMHNYIYYIPLTSDEGIEYIQGVTNTWNEVCNLLVGIVTGYEAAKKVRLVYNKETKTVEEQSCQ